MMLLKCCTQYVIKLGKQQGPQDWKKVSFHSNRKEGQCQRMFKCQLPSCVRLLATLWTITHQASLSMGFSRQEYQSEKPFPSPGDLPNPGIEPGSPAVSLLSETPGEAKDTGHSLKGKVPLRLELRSLDSESRVLTIKPWNYGMLYDVLQIWWLASWLAFETSFTCQPMSGHVSFLSRLDCIKSLNVCVLCKEQRDETNPQVNVFLKHPPGSH